MGLPVGVERVVTRYLASLDRALPGRIVGLYVVGSTALGAYRPARSDIDMIAVIDDAALSATEVRRLRAAIARVNIEDAVLIGIPAQRRGLSWPGGRNAVIATAEQLRSPASHDAVYSHVGLERHVGWAFDANPVIWTELAHHGIAQRGPDPAQLGVHVDDNCTRAFCAHNLDSYWSNWPAIARRYNRAHTRLRGRYWAAWGTLGAPRLHATIATGQILTKEQAGEYARERFDRRWHPLIDSCLAYWRQERPPPGSDDPAALVSTAAAFVTAVVKDARGLPPQPT